jgi:hypothetical protein
MHYTHRGIVTPCRHRFEHFTVFRGGVRRYYESSGASSSCLYLSTFFFFFFFFSFVCLTWGLLASHVARTASWHSLAAFCGVSAHFEADFLADDVVKWECLWLAFALVLLVCIIAGSNRIACFVAFHSCLSHLWLFLSKQEDGWQVNCPHACFRRTGDAGIGAHRRHLRSVDKGNYSVETGAKTAWARCQKSRDQGERRKSCSVLCGCLGCLLIFVLTERSGACATKVRVCFWEAEEGGSCARSCRGGGPSPWSEGRAGRACFIFWSVCWLFLLSPGQGRRTREERHSERVRGMKEREKNSFFHFLNCFVQMLRRKLWAKTDQQSLEDLEKESEEKLMKDLEEDGKEFFSDAKVRRKEEKILSFFCS